MLIDKLLKSADATAQARALAQLCVEIDTLTCVPTLFSDFNLGNESLLACGWMAQPLLDLKVLCILGQVAALGSNAIPFSMRRIVGDMVGKDNIKKVSPRLKSYFRPRQGASESRLRKAWERFLWLVPSRGGKHGSYRGGGGDA